MNTFSRRALLGVAGIGVLLVAALSTAGPVNPPVGAVVSTGRTLDEIYNRIPAAAANGTIDGRTPIPASSTGLVLSAAGSYVLTGNITAVANIGDGNGGDGVTITADGVTLDLNGFTVASAPGISTGYGIVTAAGIKRTVVRNGTINGFLVGIVINSVATEVALTDLVISNAKSYGIIASGNANRSINIQRCKVMDIGSTTVAGDPAINVGGISVAGAGIVIQDCVVQGMVHNSGTPINFRGIYFPAAIGTQQGNLVWRCVVVAPALTTGVGIGAFSGGGGNYRDCTVLNFATAYQGGGNMGGNLP